jgi:hypothetical protein
MSRYPNLSPEFVAMFEHAPELLAEADAAAANQKQANTPDVQRLIDMTPEQRAWMKSKLLMERISGKSTAIPSSGTGKPMQIVDWEFSESDERSDTTPRTIIRTEFRWSLKK